MVVGTVKSKQHMHSMASEHSCLHVFAAALHLPHRVHRALLLHGVMAGSALS
jgi:hypothetical protein